MEDGKGDLLSKIDNNATANGIVEMPIRHTLEIELLANESLLVLREEWFNSHKFAIGIPISDKKYRYSGSKYQNYFYPFND